MTNYYNEISKAQLWYDWKKGRLAYVKGKLKLNLWKWTITVSVYSHRKQNKKMNDQFVKRLKSFGWRFGLFMIVAVLGYLSEHIPELGFPEIVTTLVVFICNEGTKYFNRV